MMHGANLLKQKETPRSSSFRLRGRTPSEKLTLDELAKRFPSIAKDRRAIEITIEQLSRRFKTIAPETVEQIYVGELCKILESKPTVLLFIPVISIKAAVDELCKLQPAQNQGAAEAQAAAPAQQEEPHHAPNTESRMRNFFRRFLFFGKRPPLAESPTS